MNCNDKDEVEAFCYLFGLILLFLYARGLVNFCVVNCLVILYNSSPSRILSELVHLVNRIAKNRSPLVSHDSFESDSIPF